MRCHSSTYLKGKVNLRNQYVLPDDNGAYSRRANIFFLIQVSLCTLQFGQLHLGLRRLTYLHSVYLGEVVAAPLETYGHLIMDDAEVESVCRAAPNATVIASHMDTVAHASLTRKTLRAALERRGLAGRVLMPDDGEEYVF